MNRRKDSIIAYILLSPALLLYSVFIFCPFLYGFFISLNQWDGFTDMKFVGLSNYLGILKDELFYNAAWHNVLYAAGTVIGKVGISLFIALLLNRRGKGLTFFRVVFFFPVVMSFVAIGVLWQRMYDPNLGLLDMFLLKTGIVSRPIEWLADPGLALWSLVMVDIWKWAGYHTVLFLAGLKTIPTDMYESSYIDGAGSWKKFRYITIPQLMPVTLINITVSLMGAFSVFDLVYIMTKGGPYRSTEVMMTYMYDTTFGGSGSNFGYGSAVAYILFVFILIITIIHTKFMNKQDSL